MITLHIKQIVTFILEQLYFFFFGSSKDWTYTSGMQGKLCSTELRPLFFIFVFAFNLF